MTEIIKFEQGSWPRKCRNLWAILTCLVWLFLPGCTTDIPDDVAEAYLNLGTIDFNSQVKPILSDKCFQCHGPDQAKQKAGLRLDVAASAYDELPDNPGKFAIKPGNLQKSELFHRIVSNDPDFMMPAPESNLNLSAREKAVLIKWIEQQAVYQPHWAFIKPKQVSPPEVLHKDWAVTPIDRFVLQQMEERQLKPTEQAPKDLLLRRLSLDLTGLAPTIDEIKAFEQDLSEDAYEKQVDRLLASPHYGEKMAMDWMDLARYADTHGYQVDRYRDMSPWRDWVIKAFNQNMSYNEFVTWQLAGDLLPNPTREQILATGFNRLHPQNLEGGIVDEEFRVAYVSDRTDVLGQGLMGLTLACAKCHDHKFDPISQENYYQLYSFFNNVNESGQISWEGATPVPTLLLPTDQQEEILEYLEKKTRESEKNLQNVTDKINQQFERWVQSQSYHKLKDNRFPGEPVAHFEFENDLNNSVYPEQQAKMDRMFSSGETPVYTKGYQGQGILLDGDAWIDLKNIGRFRRSQPFSVGLNIFIPHDLENGVLFHKGNGARIYNFRGYHLALKNNHLELLMAHTWPDNAIVEYTTNEVPKDTWLQLTVTYDGSSKASGFRVYLDGEELATQVEVDNLYKDIIFSSSKHDGYANPDEPGLQIGARWRGKGLGGATVDNIAVYQRELAPLEVKQLAAPEQFRNVVAMASNQLGDQHQELLKTYYLNNYSPDYKLAVKRLTHDREVLSDSMEQVKEIMVMKEMAQPRKSYVLERGLYNSYGQQVTPNTPQSILKMPEDFPKNRMGLAQWITHPDHPLTARVAVNRYWQNYFGTGLVKTTEDFGNQGDLPSHPQLYNPENYLGEDRKEMLEYLRQLNEVQYGVYGDPEIKGRIAQYEMAYRMQASVPDAIDLSDEPDHIFELYGEDSRDPGTYAANCLLARKLLENDVRFVQLYHKGWDQHTFLPSGIKNQCKNTDQATAALVKDLKQRGLLDDTLVIWGGEFGRTVYSQGKLTEDNYGRDHHPRCFTMWMAGAGVKPGFSYGQTDDFSYNIVKDRVHVHDFQATIMHLMGIDHERLTYKFQGRRFRLTDVHGHVVNDILT